MRRATLRCKAATPAPTPRSFDTASAKSIGESSSHVDTRRCHASSAITARHHHWKKYQPITTRPYTAIPHSSGNRRKPPGLSPSKTKSARTGLSLTVETCSGGPSDNRVQRASLASGESAMPISLPAATASPSTASSGFRCGPAFQIKRTSTVSGVITGRQLQKYAGR